MGLHPDPPELFFTFLKYQIKYLASLDEPGKDPCPKYHGQYWARWTSCLNQRKEVSHVHMVQHQWLIQWVVGTCWNTDSVLESSRQGDLLWYLPGTFLKWACPGPMTLFSIKSISEHHSFPRCPPSGPDLNLSIEPAETQQHRLFPDPLTGQLLACSLPLPSLLWAY